MTPLFFGHGGRRLFGAYAPAPGRTAGNRAYVLCPPWGQEYLRSHRSLRQLATMLSAAGCNVLRFDYFGTGDSSGDMAQADLRGWVADIASAIEEVRDMSGATRVGLVGLRLGATLASIAAARQPRGIDSLVLWDPVVSGRDYLRELLDSEIWSPRGMVKPPPRPAVAGGGHEIHGFPMTADMATELASIDLSALAQNLPARTLVLASKPDPSLDFVRRALDERTQGAAAVEEIPSQPAWIEDRDTGAGAVPVKLLQRVVQWLG